jgi:hypothetical protein
VITELILGFGFFIAGAIIINEPDLTNINPDNISPTRLTLGAGVLTGGLSMVLGGGGLGAYLYEKPALDICRAVAAGSIDGISRGTLAIAQAKTAALGGVVVVASATLLAACGQLVSHFAQRAQAQQAQHPLEGASQDDSLLMTSLLID